MDAEAGREHKLYSLYFSINAKKSVACHSLPHWILPFLLTLMEPDTKVNTVFKAFHRASTPENCALDENGNLKNASEITFFNSPSDEKPISGPGLTIPTSPLAPAFKTGRPRRNANQAKFHHALAADKMDSDDDDAKDNPPPLKLSSTNKKRKPEASADSDSETTRSVAAPKTKPKPKPAPKRVKAASTQIAQHFLKKSSDASHTVTRASITVTQEPPQDDTLTTATTIATSNAPIPPTTPSGDTDVETPDVSICVAVTTRRFARSDVLTFCRELSVKDDGGNFECLICA